MNTGEIIERVKMFADEAHGDQMRRYAKERYIVHPIRVMEIVREYSQEIPLLAAALLHDVLEDTPTTADQLRSFLDSVMNKDLADRTFLLVEELTDVYVKSAYPKMNRRTRRTREAERLAEVSADAHTVKYADIIDNVQDIPSVESDFALTYIRESKQLLSHMPHGNPKLYSRALAVIDDSTKEHFSKANIKAL
jgi:guanosine-3',5'-bis(diphosphate) 3'-pyrophosphohydrolase